MILELPHYTQEQYEARKSDFYKKPGIPEIEIELEAFQKRLVLEDDFSVLPAFQQKLAIYAKSLLLQSLKGSSDFIDPEKVEFLADLAAANFLHRYFRIEDPIVGASFAGLLQFKVKEVVSTYFKTLTIESNVSLDTEIDREENGGLTVEHLLAFKHFKDTAEESSNTLDDRTDEILEKIETECSLLKQLRPNPKRMSMYFLQYLIYVYILQSTKMHKRLTNISNQAANLIVADAKNITSLLSILESALLDIFES